MFKTRGLSLVLTGLLVACAGPAPRMPADPPPVEPSAPNAQVLPYPNTKRVDVVDDYHGTSVADPYRWLEDQDGEETAVWVEAQNQVTFGYLERIAERGAIRKRLTGLWNYERFGTPHKQGGKYFISRNDGLQNQSVLYWTEKLDGELKLLIDPNTLSEDGTVALSGTSISDDGKSMAYGLAASGSDWQEWRVRDIETGQDTGDHLKWIKFSGAAWTKDNKGFFYARYAEPKSEGGKYEDVNYYQKLYYHRVGDQQTDDRLTYQRKDHKDWGFSGHVTEDGEYLIIRVRVGTDRKNGVFYQDLGRKRGRRRKSATVELLNDFDASYSFVGNKGPVFWFRTDLDAPRGRVVAIDTRKPEKKHWKELIPESEDALRGVSAVGNRFIAQYLHDAYSQVKVFKLNGKLERAIKLPGIGSAGGFGGKQRDKETFYSFNSYTTPATIYRYETDSGRSEVFKKPSVEFDPADYETEQVFYESKDGTRIPMFISRKKGTPRDGKRPTYLYGYGGFNIAITPRFSVPNLVWMEMGGVLSLHNIRGGVNMAKTGTRPARSYASRTCSTISSRPVSGSSPTNGPTRTN